MSAPKVYIIHPAAYYKLLFHAARYPFSPSVQGILLSTTTASSDEVEIVDAVPISHLWPNLTPIHQLALELISTHFKAKQGVRIAGFYQVAPNEEISKPGLQILNTIDDEDVLGLALDQRKWDLEEPSPTALKGYVKKDQVWKRVREEDLKLSDPMMPAIAAGWIREQRQQDLVDFDTHLELGGKGDWLSNELVMQKLLQFS